jgi:hypothetical protein
MLVGNVDADLTQNIEELLKHPRVGVMKFAEFLRPLYRYWEVGEVRSPFSFGPTKRYVRVEREGFELKKPLVAKIAELLQNSLPRSC